MRINNNIAALNTHRQMGINTEAAAKSMEKLSSGMRINRAGDDAAGLSISEKMRSQLKGLESATRNAQDGISLIQTAEGALGEVSSMLVRMKELSVQRENGTYNTDDVAAITAEMGQLVDEIHNIVDNTTFNGISVLDQAAPGIDITLSHDAGVTMTIPASILTETLKLTGASTPTQVETSISELNNQRAVYGALQNRLEHTINNMGATSENLTAAESRIRDTDMAKEMMEFTKNNILNQAAQSMLAQANQFPQGVLQLLK